MSSPLISLLKVGKSFPGGMEAMVDVDLGIDQGEFLCCLGPSGCGKSTLLRLLAGLDTPSTGRILFDEQQYAKPSLLGISDQNSDHAHILKSPSKNSLVSPPLGGGVGFVFQEPTLLPWARVEDNISLPLRLMRVPADEIGGRVEESLKQVGLSDFAKFYPRQLSGGMKMRVAIARALVTHPRLLLMDEPFAALDELTRMRLNDDLLAIWQKEKITVIFVTHSVYEAAYLATRVIQFTPRPGTIQNSIKLFHPIPRPVDYRLSEEYLGACRQVNALSGGGAPLAS